MNLFESLTSILKTLYQNLLSGHYNLLKRLILYRLPRTLSLYSKRIPRRTGASKLAPIAAVSFLWSVGVVAKQKDLAESGRGFSTSEIVPLQKKCALLFCLDRLVQHFYLKTISVFCVFLLSFSISGQPIIEWEKSFGGTSVEGASSIQQTTDGGYIVAGASKSSDGNVGGNNGINDCWIIKLDEAGNLEWEKNYGGTGNDFASLIQQTTDGGYIVVGVSDSSDGDVTGENYGLFDYWILKLDESGNLEWENNFGGTSSDSASIIRQTNNGEYIVSGSSLSNNGDVGGNNGSYDCWIIKLDQLGNLLWEQNYGGTGADFATSIQQTTDEGYIVGGSSRSNNNEAADSWIIKLDRQGNIVWEQNYGGTEADWAKSIEQTDDGGYIMAGASYSNDGDVGGNNGESDNWIVKLDDLGNLQWERNFGSVGIDRPESIQQSIDGGYIIIGTTVLRKSNGLLELPTYWIIKLDQSGNLKWEQNFGDISENEACCIEQTIDGGYVIAGTLELYRGNPWEDNGDSDVWILKLSSFPNMDELCNPPTIGTIDCE